MSCGFCQRVRQFFGRPLIDPGNVGFDERPGTFRVGYREVRQPDPGIGYHPYQSLALMEYPPSGPTVTVRHPLNTFFPQMVVGFGVQDASIAAGGFVAGQVYGTPLFDPQSGYVGDPMGTQISPLVPLNIPATHPNYPNKSTVNQTARTRLRPGV
jgi:hypothetical protein